MLALPILARTALSENVNRKNLIVVGVIVVVVVDLLMNLKF